MPFANNLIAFWINPQTKKASGLISSVDKMQELIDKLTNIRDNALFSGKNGVRFFYQKNSKKGDNERAPDFYINAVYNDGSEDIPKDDNIEMGEEPKEMEEQKWN